MTYITFMFLYGNDSLIFTFAGSRRSQRRPRNGRREARNSAMESAYYSYWIVNVACPLAVPAPTVPAWVCT